MGEDSARLEYGKFGENCQVFDGWPIFSPIFSPHRAHRAPGTGKWCEPDSPRHWESTNYGDKAWGRIRLDWNMANSGEIVKHWMGGRFFQPTELAGKSVVGEVGDLIEPVINPEQVAAIVVVVADDDVVGTGTAERVGGWCATHGIGRGGDQSSCSVIDVARPVAGGIDGLDDVPGLVEDVFRDKRQIAGLPENRHGWCGGAEGASGIVVFGGGGLAAGVGDVGSSSSKFMEPESGRACGAI